MYAENTAVPTDRSKAEIERTLIRYGATAFNYAWESTRALILFRLRDRFYRVVFPLPARPEVKDDVYEHDALGRWRKVTPKQQLDRWEKSTRQRWRAAALIIKAKLEAVDAGISTVESEFLADTILPDNTRFGDWAQGQLKHVYETGSMPLLAAESHDGGRSS